MSLENLITSRRNFLKAGLAVALGLSTSPLDSAEQPKKQYSFCQFKQALRERWKTLDDNKKAKTEKAWRRYTSELQEKLVESYSNPDETYKSLTKEQKEQFAEFVKGYHEKQEIPFLDIKVIEKSIKAEFDYQFPWQLNIENPNLSEKLILFYYLSREN